MSQASRSDSALGHEFLDMSTYGPDDWEELKAILKDTRHCETLKRKFEETEDAKTCETLKCEVDETLNSMCLKVTQLTKLDTSAQDMGEFLKYASHLMTPAINGKVFERTLTAIKSICYCLDCHRAPYFCPAEYKLKDCERALEVAVQALTATYLHHRCEFPDSKETTNRMVES